MNAMDAARTLFILAALVQLVAWTIVALRPRAAGDPSVPAVSPGAVLHYGPVLRWFAAAVAFAIPALLIAAMLLIPFPQLTRLALLGVNLLVLGFIGGFLLVATQRTRIVVHDQGVVGQSPFRPRREFTWGEIHQVTYSALDHCLILHGSGRRTIRASLFLVGIHELTRAIKQHLSADRYASAIKRLR
jgi:hypothetical protein